LASESASAAANNPATPGVSLLVPAVRHAQELPLLPPDDKPPPGEPALAVPPVVDALPPLVLGVVPPVVAVTPPVTMLIPPPVLLPPPMPPAPPAVVVGGFAHTPSWQAAPPGQTAPVQAGTHCPSLQA
jgi:hypothetical protein